MKKAVILFSFVFTFVFWIQAGPSFSEDGKTSTKDIIMQGLKVLQGFQGQKALPDLIVEKIWLDDSCQINVRVKNNGNAAIPDVEYSKAVMRIASGKLFKDFPYTDALATGQTVVDPGGALKAPGGSVEFNTGVKINRSLKVSVFVDPRRSIQESNEGNNRKIEELNPQCSQQIQTTGMDSSSTPSERTEPSPSGQGAAQEASQDKNVSGTSVSEKPTGSSTSQTSTTGDVKVEGQPEQSAPVSETTTKSGEKQ